MSISIGNSGSYNPLSQLQQVKVKGADEAEATSQVPEAKEQPKEMPMQVDARSGASPAVYA